MLDKYVFIYRIVNVCTNIYSTWVMKQNEELRILLRNFVSETFLTSCMRDKRGAVDLVVSTHRFNDLTLSVESLISLSAGYRPYNAPTPYDMNVKHLYDSLDLSGIMTYKQFIFELPRLWYTTLYRLLCEWKEEFSEDVGMAY